MTVKRFQNSLYLGPDLCEGPLPTLFYFALSADDSLTTDPFNQPAVFLEQFPMRIFSMDVPFHGHGLSALTAMSAWAEEISKGRDPITPFVKQVQMLIKELQKKGALLEGKLAAAGLSRGAFIATHAAAKIHEIKFLLGFAPLTKLSHIKEFKEMTSNPLAESLNLHHLADQIAERTIRFYIGNLDKRVGTRHTFDFIELTASKAAEKKLRSPAIELFIKPSLGHQGHGTSKDIFHEGALWIASLLELSP